MNLKNFPKKLDSKTSCLRITVPENLDLALEGLIRKVLREQPKTDDIYSFAADYFETLLKIRNAAGRKSSAGQLHSFRDDEDAREMVKLANTFPKPVEKLAPSLNSLKKNVQTNKKVGEPLPSKTTAKEKVVKKKAPLKKNEDTQKVSKESEELINRPTPDLIKKLPLTTEAEFQPKANVENTAEPSDEKLENKEETDLIDEDEEFLKSDPIKELVEKELKSEAKEKTDVGKSNEDPKAESPGVKAIEEEKPLDNVGNEVCTVTDKHNTVPKVSEDKPENKEIVGGESEVVSEEKSHNPEENVEAVINDSNNKKEDENDETNELYKKEEKEKEKETTTAEPSNIQEKEEAQLEVKEEVMPNTAESKSSELAAEPSEAIEDNQIDVKEKESPQDVAENLLEDKTSAPPADTEVTSQTQEGSAPEIKKDTEILQDASQTVQSQESEKHEAINKEENEAETQQKVEKDIKVVEGKTETDEQKIPGETSSTQETISEIKIEDKESEGEKEGENQNKNDTMSANEGKIEENQTEKTETTKKEEDAVVPVVDEKESKSLEETTALGKDTENAVAIQESQEPQKEVEEEKKEESEGNDQSLQDKKISQVNETPIKVEENHLTTEDPQTKEKPKDEEVKPAEENEINFEVKEETINKVEGISVASTEEVSRPKRDISSPVEEMQTDNPINDIQVNEDKKLEEKEQPAEDNETSKPDELLESSENPVVEEVKTDSEEVKTSEDSTGEKYQPLEEPEVKDINQDIPNPENLQTPVNNNVEEENTDNQLEVKVEKDEDVEEKGAEILEIPKIEEEGSESKVESQAEDELCTVVDSLEIKRINEAQKVEEMKLHEDKQIKTIETHYYDLLKVPETVMKEYKVHRTIDDAGSTGSIIRSYQVVKELPEEGKEPTTLGEQDKMDYLLSVGKAERPESEMPNDELPDLMTPSSSYSLNLSEMSIQTVSEMFLDSEKQYSSLGQEEVRYTTPKETQSVDDNVNDTRKEVEEVIEKTVIPSAVGAVPVPPREVEEIKAETNTSTLQQVQEEKKEEKPENSSSEDSNETADGSRSNNSKSIDSDTPIISVEVKTIIETQVLDDEEEESDKKNNERLLTERSPDVEVTVKATIDLAVEEDTRETASQTVSLEEKKDEEEKENGEKPQVKDASNDDKAQRTLSGEQIIGREGSSGESDTTTSSAATEIKRSDSVKRNFANSRSLLTTQSLDSDKKSTFTKTRSLSTIRHGVTDFEVWNTIEKELEEAATKIQSKFRGYTTRKRLRREDAVQITTEESSSPTPTDQDVKEECQQSTGEFHDSIVLSEHPR